MGKGYSRKDDNGRKHPKVVKLNESDFRNMISEATRRIIKEYWTSADDAAEEAHRKASQRIEQEFREILKTDSRYVYQAERLKSSFERFMKAFEKEKEKLAARFNANARLSRDSVWYPNDFGIYIRDVEGEVVGGMENIDVRGGHRLKYQGNSYEKGVLDFNRMAPLELTVKFSLNVVTHHDEHEVRPANSWWEDAEGNPVRGGDPGARRIPDYNPEWEKDHEGEDDWVSPDGKWRHTVKHWNITTNRDVFKDKEKGRDEDYVAAYEALAVRNLAKLGRDRWNNWRISSDDSTYGSENNYKVTFFI